MIRYNFFFRWIGELDGEVHCSVVAAGYCMPFCILLILLSGVWTQFGFLLEAMSRSFTSPAWLLHNPQEGIQAHHLTGARNLVPH